MDDETKDFVDEGELSIDNINDMNVPVNIFIEEEDDGFRLTAANFMPRKQVVSDAAYIVFSEKREVLEAIVQKKIVPLYEVALENLKTKSTNYYWEKGE